MDKDNLINTIPELCDKLSTPQSLVSDPVVEFERFAKGLMRNFQIKKGDKLYWMTDIELDIYSDEHKDIITYPRNSPAGVWFFHRSGVDITFKSEVDPHARTLVRKPELTSASVFGGILLRGIVMDGNPSINADGPYKVCDELFDQFNAYETPRNFPRIVMASSPRSVEVKRKVRVGMDEKAETKVPKILSENYCKEQGHDEKLIELFTKEHDDYRKREYRFYIDSRS